MDPLEQHLHSQVCDNAGMFWHRLRWRAMSGRVPRQTELDLLDVGAGTGVLGEFLARDRPRVRYNFLEPVESLARGMEERWGAARNAARRENLTQYRILTLLDVIEHVPDDREFCRDLLERAEPSSRIIITVPALPRLWSEWDVALGHYRRYTKRTLAQLLASLHLQTEEVSYLFPELLPAALVRRNRRGPSEAEWPRLPPFVDRALYSLGVPSVAARKLWPFGTSLLAVCRRA
jgi:hypothetical protein